MLRATSNFGSSTRRSPQQCVFHRRQLETQPHRLRSGTLPGFLLGLRQASRSEPESSSEALWETRSGTSTPALYISSRATYRKLVTATSSRRTIRTDDRTP